MIKVTTIQKCFMDGTIYLYSERYHRIEYEDGTVEESKRTLWELREKFETDYKKEVKIKKVQVHEDESRLAYY